MTPYDWQESIGQKAEYVESRLAGGLPGAAVSLKEGIVMAALKRQSQKVFEIYDHLAMTALGAQADVESIRVAAIEFCHREGYQRSADDVTLKRLIHGLSDSVRGSFSSLRVAPLVARALFCELGEDPSRDRCSLLDYDGDFTEAKSFMALTGRPDARPDLESSLAALAGGSPEEILTPLEAALREAGPEGDFAFEAALLSREAWSDRRLRWLTPSPLA